MEDDTIDVEVITPSIDDLLHSIKGNETLDSGKIFADLMAGKIDDALAQEKVRIANVVYNGQEEETEEEEIDSDVEDDDEDLDPEVEAEVDALLADAEPEDVLDIDLGGDDEHEEPEDALGLYDEDEAESDIEDILSDDEDEE
tara:strand:- start:3402 stop:3830 length:429 start_codon:yes stop_codon:yes gene_type:complete